MISRGLHISKERVRKINIKDRSPSPKIEEIDELSYKSEEENKDEKKEPLFGLNMLGVYEPELKNGTIEF